jgi:hypothetical protein
VLRAFRAREPFGELRGQPAGLARALYPLGALGLVVLGLGALGLVVVGLGGAGGWARRAIDRVSA